MADKRVGIVIDVSTDQGRRQVEALAQAFTEAGNEAKDAEDKGLSPFRKKLNEIMQSARVDPLRAMADGYRELSAQIKATVQHFSEESAEFARVQKLTLRYADALGVTADAMEALSVVGSKAGITDIGQMASQVLELNRNAAMSAMGIGRLVKFFQALKIDVKDEATGKMRSATAIYTDVVDKLATMKDGTLALALAERVLGGQGTELVMMLRQRHQTMSDAMADAEKYRVLTDEQRKAGADLAAATGALKRSQNALHEEFAARLAPSLTLIKQKQADLTLEVAKSYPAMAAFLEIGGEITPRLVPAAMAVVQLGAGLKILGVTSFGFLGVGAQVAAVVAGISASCANAVLNLRELRTAFGEVRKGTFTWHDALQLLSRQLATAINPALGLTLRLLDRTGKFRFPGFGSGASAPAAVTGRTISASRYAQAKKIVDDAKAAAADGKDVDVDDAKLKQAMEELSLGGMMGLGQNQARAISKAEADAAKIRIAALNLKARTIGRLTKEEVEERKRLAAVVSEWSDVSGDAERQQRAKEAEEKRKRAEEERGKAADAASAKFIANLEKRKAAMAAELAAAELAGKDTKRIQARIDAIDKEISSANERVAKRHEKDQPGGTAKVQAEAITAQADRDKRDAEQRLSDAREKVQLLAAKIAKLKSDLGALVEGGLAADSDRAKAMQEAIFRAEGEWNLARNALAKLEGPVSVAELAAAQSSEMLTALQDAREKAQAARRAQLELIDEMLAQAKAAGDLQRVNVLQRQAVDLRYQIALGDGDPSNDAAAGVRAANELAQANKELADALRERRQRSIEAEVSAAQMGVEEAKLAGTVNDQARARERLNAALLKQQRFLLETNNTIEAQRIGLDRLRDSAEKMKSLTLGQEVLAANSPATLESVLRGSGRLAGMAAVPMPSAGKLVVPGAQNDPRFGGAFDGGPVMDADRLAREIGTGVTAKLSPQMVPIMVDAVSQIVRGLFRAMRAGG